MATLGLKDILDLLRQKQHRVDFLASRAGRKKNAREIIMSGGAFLFCKALKIILPACLDEITGWFRLFQSTGEIKAAFIYFYLFLLWAD